MIVVYFEYHNPRCDCCGHLLAAEKNGEAAEAAMRADGWAKIDGKDVCRLCQQKAKETGKLPEPIRFWQYTKHLTERRNADGRESIGDRTAVHSGAPGQE